MNHNFHTALENAMTSEFSWLDDLENPYSEYQFSAQFESNMKAIVPKVEFSYVSVGKKRIRKTMLAAMIALLALVITGCAVAVHYFVEWHEEQNSTQGTLDVTFELDERQTSESIVKKLPVTPPGYTISEEFNDNGSCIIIYSDSQGNQIIYSHQSNIENMDISIDNEDAVFEETTVNGCKGYRSSKDGTTALYWASGTYFYELQGTCNMDILWQMAESMVK